MSYIQLTISDDELQAFLEVTPAIYHSLNPESFVEEARNILIDNGIKERFIWVDVLQNIQDILVSHRITAPYRDLVAAGIPPQNGEDSQLTFYVAMNPAVGKANTESDKVDYKERNYVQVVTKGTLLADLRKPTEGVDGKTLRDQPIPAIPGELRHVVKFAADQIQLSAQDESFQYTALKKGWLKFEGGVLSIERSLVVPSHIDITTGNIRSTGDVTIQGDIRDGFEIETDGDVVIQGNVERNARITGRDISVGGVCHGIVRAANNFSSKVLEYTYVTAGNLVAVDTVYQCRIYASSIVADNVKASLLQASNLIQVESVHRTEQNPTTLIILPHIYLHRTLNAFYAEMSYQFFQRVVLEREAGIKPNAEQTAAIETINSELHAMVQRVSSITQQNNGKVKAKFLGKGTVVTMYGHQRKMVSDYANIDLQFNPETRRIIGGNI
ncbi:FapA family protein [Chrysiogenes arsenatis]|uniref:FapA family protein n=1 Tax=Chrysiogenes arsenatis TaxID=309797 RepID=UPI000401B81D|nr:FapA family protein [Chrysiogenes arsenatis]